ncbi:MAG TPA: translation initiation factor [Opitutaceae bacterium]|nr:translation initiation factor [Opitutaceae bacterium]
MRREDLKVADRMPTHGGQGLGHNPFGALDGTGLPRAVAPAPKRVAEAAAPQKNRGRVDVTREKAGRGGKTVTVVDGFAGIGLPEKEQLVRAMRAACGCGGTVKGGRLEIQGDQREVVSRILAESGFRPVYAGG